MTESDLIRLQHMLDAAQQAVAFMKGRSRFDLDEDEMLALAITRLIEIIGEAAKHVPQKIRIANPDIPWQQIAGTRDRLIHGYYTVDLNVVWTIVTRDLPPLIHTLQRIFTEQANE